MKKYLLFILFLLLSCNDENKIITQNGFFLYVKDTDLTFVPIKSKFDRWIFRSFLSGNLKKGFQIKPHDVGIFYKELIANCDTFRINNYLGENGKNESLKITPVEIQYIIKPEKKNISYPDFILMEKYEINNKNVEFKIDDRLIEIKYIKPIISQ